MKTVTETFTYQIPDDCDRDDFITFADYVDSVQYQTCPFYDGCDEYLTDDYYYTININ